MTECLTLRGRLSRARRSVRVTANVTAFQNALAGCGMRIAVETPTVTIATVSQGNQQ